MLLLLLHSQESTSQKTLAPPAPNDHFIWTVLLVNARGGRARPIRHHAGSAGSAELNQPNLLQYTQARSTCFWSFLQNSCLRKITDPAHGHQDRPCCTSCWLGPARTGWSSSSPRDTGHARGSRRPPCYCSLPTSWSGSSPRDTAGPFPILRRCRSGSSPRDTAALPKSIGTCSTACRDTGRTAYSLRQICGHKGRYRRPHAIAILSTPHTPRPK
jgi:hypothetical protein